MGRLLAFPEPLPDESLYSLAVRYHRTVANESYRLTSHELFGSYSRTCGSVLPCCLGALSQRLEGIYSVRELIESRTLLPLYMPFLGNVGYDSAIRCMEGSKGTGLKLSLGITASGLLKHASFRYCEGCVQDDIQAYGVPYWHRIHMAAGVCTCPLHGQVLRSVSFPSNMDWRCMLLPGEIPGTPVLSDFGLGAARAIAIMQNWGLENPLRVTDLLHGDILRYRLSEMGLLHRGRLREQAIRSHVVRRFSDCTRSSEFLSVTGDCEWVLRVLRRHGRIIQPFHFYFLCWILELALDDLCGSKANTGLQGECVYLPTRSRNNSPSKNEIAAHRIAFANDRNQRCHNKVGYHWLFHHDREWLQCYVNSHRLVSLRKARVDWGARDTELSTEIMAAHDELLASKGKPIKITQAALIRRSSYCHDFLRNSSKLSESAKLIKELLETEHDYQIRKVVWAIKILPMSKWHFPSILLRTAGVRVKRISDDEIRNLVEEALAA